MADAAQCDACAGFARPGHTVSLEVEVPYEDDPTTSRGWDVDICYRCWGRPLRELLESACADLSLELEGPPQPPAPAPGKESKPWTP